MTDKIIPIALALALASALPAVAQTPSETYTMRRSTTPDGRTQTQRVQAAPDQMTKMFERFDLNKDGYIDAEEERRGRTQSLDGSQSRAGGLIAMFDRDGDGRVSLREFLNATAPANSNRPQSSGPR